MSQDLLQHLAALPTRIRRLFRFADMALSQLQCLDDNHVNPRTHESKPEFLYCEEQRLALEALLRGGRDAFAKCLRERGLRGFLSEPEQDALARAAEPYDPGSELFQEDAADDEPPLSLHYWPELSDTSVPQMDLGWPDCESYRGVTRTTVYAQPPLDGQAHIKEIVRKMIAQAQKVIAVVMDAFTDVDIFQDLLDASFKRRVSVYILLERTGLPHFLSMCQRANMHPGHFKHLRVRCTEGAEFCTRSSTRVRGQLGHRFMFVDGDKAVSGSYSFTWMSSRLDRNLITVVTGQAVEAFDRLFRFLYMTSSSVDLRQVTLEPEPEPEPLPPPPIVVPPSAADVRKLYNPKYALVAAGNQSLIPSAGQGSPKEPQPSENSKNQETKKRRIKDTLQEAPPLHPGLIHLEKVYLISYLPTWPEPDPSSDVIGFINIRDAKKPTQFNMQRSEMFETSQAIRFSSPFSVAKAVLPDVAQRRQITPKNEEKNKPQPSQNNAKAEESVVDGVQATPLSAEPGDIKPKGEAPEEKSSTSGQKSEPGRDTIKALNTENKLHSNTPTNQDAGHGTSPHHSARTPPQSSNGTSTPNTDTAQSFTTSSPEAQSLPESSAKKKAQTSLNTQSAAVYKTHTPELSGPAHSNSEQRTQTKTGVSQTDSHTQAVLAQPHNSSEMTPNTQTPTAHTPSASPVHPQPVSSTSLSGEKNTPCPAVDSRTATSVCAPVPTSSCSSSVPPLISSSTTVQPPLPQPSASSCLTLVAPVPKPRTVHLVIKEGRASHGPKLPEISVVRRPESLAGTGRTVAHSKPDAANVVQSPPENGPETVSQLQDNGGSKTGTQNETEISVEGPKPEQNVTSPERKGEETIGLRGDRAATQSAAGIKAQAQSDVLTSDAPKANTVNILEIIPKDVEPKSLTSSDCKMLSKTETDCVATAQTDTKAPEKTLIHCKFANVPKDTSENVIQCKTYLARSRQPQRISCCELNPAGFDVLETMDSLKASTTHTPVSATTTSTPTDSGGNPIVTSAHHTDSKPNVAKHNAHTTITAQESQQTPKDGGSSRTPQRPQYLNLSKTHTPDSHSPTAERESQQLPSLVRTTTPDGFLPRTPTPDFRTPTPDGYVSSREDSGLSPTSDEYYECCDSPLRDAVFDRAGFHNYGTTGDPESPLYINNITCMFGEMDGNETQSLSTTVSTSSSLLEKIKVGEGKELTIEENEREKDVKRTEVSVAGRRTEEDYQRPKRSDEAKTKAEHHQESTAVVETDKKAQPQAAERKRLPNQSAAQRLVDGGGTPGESEMNELKGLSTGDLEAEQVSSDGVKEKVVDEAALRPSGVESRDRPQSPRETEGPETQSNLCIHRAFRLFEASPPSANRPQGKSECAEAQKSNRKGFYCSIPQDDTIFAAADIRLLITTSGSELSCLLKAIVGRILTCWSKTNLCIFITQLLAWSGIGGYLKLVCQDKVNDVAAQTALL
ncbi:hypothetical protein F2P81_014815 [Scophthalmus maximus]|uniref:Scaffolding anchor of CK1 domain-containing protein n=1 Tax=Scophthalmus maximus TaxID=52904 RepID=A0A6A4SIU7_SCOMX|nr:hypothetical protein F2P81_014815 [Scophthalmus maximus]